jgi:hypothetical protein
MSFMAEILRGQQIEDVLVDTEVVYLMLGDGTQVSIRGLVVVEPKAENMARFCAYFDSQGRELGSCERS